MPLPCCASRRVRIAARWRRGGRPGARAPVREAYPAGGREQRRDLFVAGQVGGRAARPARQQIGRRYLVGRVEAVQVGGEAAHHRQSERPPATTTAGGGGGPRKRPLPG